MHSSSPFSGFLFIYFFWSQNFAASGGKPANKHFFVHHQILEERTEKNIENEFVNTSIIKVREESFRSVNSFP